MNAKEIRVERILGNWNRIKIGRQSQIQEQTEAMW